MQDQTHRRLTRVLKTLKCVNNTYRELHDATATSLIYVLMHVVDWRMLVRVLVEASQSPALAHIRWKEQQALEPTHGYDLRVCVMKLAQY